MYHIGSSDLSASWEVTQQPVCGQDVSCSQHILQCVKAMKSRQSCLRKHELAEYSSFAHIRWKWRSYRILSGLGKFPTLCSVKPYRVTKVRNFREKFAPLRGVRKWFRYFAMHRNSSTLFPIVLYRTKPF